MIENLQPSIAPLAVDTPVQDTSGQAAPRTAAADTGAAASKSPAGSVADATSEAAKPATRLLIDQDKTTGAFVYRIVAASNGRLLAEFPRESVDQLKYADSYAAGDLISTSA
jgi:hypothetical protein